MDQGRRVDLRPWLFAVTRNTCTDILRRGRARETFQDFDALPTHAAWADPHQSFEQRERLRLIVADLRVLPTRQRLALGAGVFAGHSHQDVATSLNTTTDHAKVLVFRARTSLRAADRRRAAFGLAA